MVGWCLTPSFVMAGLVPAIHVFFCRDSAKTWMPGTRPGMTTFVLATRALKPRVVFLQRRLQIGVDRGRIAAGFLHRLGPARRAAA